MAVLSRPEIDYEAESQLDPSLHFSAPLSRHPLSPRTVFITGATGLLGAFIVDELLRKSAAAVCCLVRASDDTAAREKLTRHLQSYGVWNRQAESRVRTVAGDVSEPRMGLDRDRYLELAARSDVVYHSAGQVNMALPYEHLKATNVTGTLEVLRFAAAECTKPVHFASSIAVFYTDLREQGDGLYETDTPLYHDSLKGGYSKSKWVADRLVAGAQQRGLPASIYRPVRIMGHSQTGAMHDTSDLLPLLLKGCILLGKYPVLDLLVTLVPVDYASRAIVHLSGQRESWGKAFHLMNHAPIEWEHLISILRSHDYSLEPMPYEQWRRELRQRCDEESGESKRALSTLFLAMTAPLYLFYKRPPMDDSQTRAGLAGTGIECPRVDSSLISAYVAYWQQCGYFPAPSALTAVAV